MFISHGLYASQEMHRISRVRKANTARIPKVDFRVAIELETDEMKLRNESKHLKFKEIRDVVI